MKFFSSQLFRLAKLASFLAPAYFRLGGTDADLVLFSNNTHIKKNFNYSQKVCDGDFNTCSDIISPDNYLVVTGKYLNFLFLIFRKCK